MRGKGGHTDRSIEEGNWVMNGVRSSCKRIAECRNGLDERGRLVLSMSAE